MEHQSGLFGTVLPSGHCGQESESRFLFALVRHSRIFRCFHFFISSGSAEPQQLFWNHWLQKEGLSDSRQVIILPAEVLAASFATHNYALFYSADLWVGQLFELRSAFAESPCAIVGRCRSLAQDLSLGLWRTVLHAHSRAGDALLCDSLASQQALGHLLDEAGRRTGDRFQGELLTLAQGAEDMAADMCQREARVALDIPEEGVAILCLGSVSPVDKADVHPLLQSLATMIDRYEYDNWYLVICGQPSDDDDYIIALTRFAAQLGIDDRIFFKFDLAPQQRYQAFAAADVFVGITDSVLADCNTSAVEAMSAGLPVVLSDWHGSRELIEHGREGFLVPTLWGDVDGLNAPSAFYDPAKAGFVQAQSVAVDVSQLTHALAQLVASKKLRDKMGRSGQKQFKKCFDWPTIVDHFDSLAAHLFPCVDRSVQATGEIHALHFYRVFSGYASSGLTGNQVVKTSLHGRQVLSGQIRVMQYEELTHTLAVNYLPQLLKASLQGQRVDDLRKSLGLARALADMLLLWSVKHGLLTTLAEPVSATGDLMLRYRRRCSLAQVQGQKRLLQRLQVAGINDVTATKPLSDKGYRGVCLIHSAEGQSLIYRPFDMQLEMALSASSGLLSSMNSWQERPLFELHNMVYSGQDRYGAYGFRSFVEGDALSPSDDLSRMGQVSAFLLLMGMSDLHGSNLLAHKGRISLIDTEMCCQTDILERLHRELCDGVQPEEWLSSSLFLTRIELLWNEMLEQGWLPEPEDIETICEGFLEGLGLVAAHADEWQNQMFALLDCPVRCDPVPFNSARPIIEQLESYDLQGTATLRELKEELRQQARRQLRLLAVNQEHEYLVETLVASWIRGEHCIRRVPSGECAREAVAGISEALKNGTAGAGCEQLAALYRGWLMSCCGYE